MAKITKELKAKWVEALRSGDYKQAEGCMHDGVGYCCLGVLARVAGYNVEDDKSDGAATGGRNQHLYDLCQLKLEGRAGYIGKGIHLAEKNDDGASFDEIADLIEENLVTAEGTL